MNLAVQDIISNVSVVLSPEAADAYSSDDIGKLREALAREDTEPAPSTDIVHTIRRLIATLRVSGQRRENLMTTIAKGNTAGNWEVSAIWKEWWISYDPDARTGARDNQIRLPEVQLLRDCPTRWSSTYLMLTRFLELYPVRNTPRFRWLRLLTTSN